MQADPERDRVETPWREAIDLLRFIAEAGAVSGAIVLIAWLLTGQG